MTHPFPPIPLPASASPCPLPPRARSSASCNEVRDAPATMGSAPRQSHRRHRARPWMPLTPHPAPACREAATRETRFRQATRYGRARAARPTPARTRAALREARPSASRSLGAGPRRGGERAAEGEPPAKRLARPGLASPDARVEPPALSPRARLWRCRGARTCGCEGRRASAPAAQSVSRGGHRRVAALPMERVSAQGLLAAWARGARRRASLGRPRPAPARCPRAADSRPRKWPAVKRTWYPQVDNLKKRASGPGPPGKKTLARFASTVPGAPLSSRGRRPSPAAWASSRAVARRAASRGDSLRDGGGESGPGVGTREDGQGRGSLEERLGRRAEEGAGGVGVGRSGEAGREGGDRGGCGRSGPGARPARPGVSRCVSTRPQAFSVRIRRVER